MSGDMQTTGISKRGNKWYKQNWQTGKKEKNSFASNLAEVNLLTSWASAKMLCLQAR